LSLIKSTEITSVHSLNGNNGNAATMLQKKKFPPLFKCFFPAFMLKIVGKLRKTDVQCTVSVTLITRG
jgi:hypothetical protein